MAVPGITQYAKQYPHALPIKYVDVIQTEKEMSRTTELIAQATHKVTDSGETGIVLIKH